MMKRKFKRGDKVLIDGESEAIIISFSTIAYSTTLKNIDDKNQYYVCIGNSLKLWVKESSLILIDTKFRTLLKSTKKGQDYINSKEINNEI